MLTDYRMHATLPTPDLERARRFWGGTLGFSVDREVESAIMYRAGKDSRFTVFLTPNVRGVRLPHAQDRGRHR